MATAASPAFVRNAWYQAAWDREVGDRPFARTLLNQPVVLFRDAGGGVHALEDRCCHRATPLRLGQVIPEGLQCGYHGLVFDGSGRCVSIPGQDTIPPQARVRSYPVVERQEFIWIWMGDPDKADERLIVDYPWHDDPARWPHRKDVFPIAGHWMLLIDNLMDPTHLGYVHRRTIGGDAATHVDARMETTRTGRGVRFIRWMLNSVPPPSYVEAVGFEGRVDRWQEFEFVAPGSVLQTAGALDVGRGAYENRDQEGGLSWRIYHGSTPETETSSFYFWSVANGYNQDDPSATDALYDISRVTFEEDVEILGAQQARLAESDAGLVDIKSDERRLIARRAVARMMAEEAQAAPAAE